VSAVGLSADERASLEGRNPAAALAVFTGEPSPDTPAIAGTYTLDAEGLHFRPRFPFVSGVTYVARLRLGGPALLRRFAVGPPGGDPPRVVAVFPSADALPQNVLRFYLHFSQPMEPKDAHRHVRLLDDAGILVSLSFVEIEHGLWDPKQTRLTMLVHPGRLKRGVAPGERLGPPLCAGHAYRLVVDASLKDAAGRPLGHAFDKRFQVAAADRESPRLAAIRLDPPSGGEAPLVAHWPEPLDEALQHRLVWVEDEDGHTVEGTASIGEGETLWAFRPSRPWSPGRYSLRIHPALEDRAGNRFDRLFDRESGLLDAAREEASAPPTDALSLPFVVVGS